MTNIRLIWQRHRFRLPLGSLTKKEWLIQDIQEVKAETTLFGLFGRVTFSTPEINLGFYPYKFLEPTALVLSGHLSRRIKRAIEDVQAAGRS